VIVARKAPNARSELTDRTRIALGNDAPLNQD